jgi:ribosomal protein S18 acetylase RimI-like enzyme
VGEARPEGVVNKPQPAGSGRVRYSAAEDRAEVRRLREADWKLFRELRLAMLADTPLAYTETLEQSRTFDEQEWRSRARRGQAGGSAATFVAADEDGGLVATMGGVLEAVRSALLVSVFVRPEYRASGLADRLLDEVLRWAREEAGARRIRLLVHEENPRAIAFYARSGFRPTGRTEPYPLDPEAREVELAMGLDASPGTAARSSRADTDRFRSRPAFGRARDPQERPR